MSKIKIRQIIILLSVFYCLAIAACGGQKPQVLPSTQAKANEYNQSGMKAAERGDYKKSLYYYEEALKKNQTIEDTEAMAVNMINMAVIYQKIGETAKAHKLIESALLVPDISNSLKSEAMFEKARLFFKGKEFSKAKEHVAKSLSLNKGPRDGSRWNLLGRIALMEEKDEEAMRAVAMALKLNQENKLTTEEANSLRLMAEINAKKGFFNESKELYLKALRIDKDIGDGKRIALDLRGLGDIALKQLNYGDAISFYKRAYDVSSSAGDVAGALVAIDSLAEAYKKSGDDKNAEEIMKKKTDYMEKK